MDLTVQSGYTLIKIGRKTYQYLQGAYQTRQKKRFTEFAKCFETRYEVMNIEDQQKLNKFIESEEGSNLLADYAESILKVSSSRVMMAMALLFCNDEGFKDREKRNFIAASTSLDDDLLDFYILTHKLKRYEHDNIPYSQVSLSNSNCDTLERAGYDRETISLYINELIRLRLLLPDPIPNTGYITKSNIWSVSFGISSKTQKIVNLIVKSEALLRSSEI